MSSRTTVLIALAAVAAIVAAQRAGLFTRLAGATAVRSVRPGAR